jgi:hypothetical protein
MFASAGPEVEQRKYEHILPGSLGGAVAVENIDVLTATESEIRLATRD